MGKMDLGKMGWLAIEEKQFQQDHCENLSWMMKANFTKEPSISIFVSQLGKQSKKRIEKWIIFYIFAKKFKKP